LNTKKTFFGELTTLINNSNNWQSTLGDIEFNQRLNKLKEVERYAEEKLSEIEREIFSVNIHIKNLEKTFE